MFAAVHRAPWAPLCPGQRAGLRGRRDREREALNLKGTLDLVVGRDALQSFQQKAIESCMEELEKVYLIWCRWEEKYLAVLILRQKEISPVSSISCLVFSILSHSA